MSQPALALHDSKPANCWALTLTDGETTQTLIVRAPNEGRAREWAMERSSLPREHCIINSCIPVEHWINRRDTLATMVDPRLSNLRAIAEPHGLQVYQFLGEAMPRAVVIASPEDHKALQDGIQWTAERCQRLERALNDCVAVMTNGDTESLDHATALRVAKILLKGDK